MLAKSPERDTIARLLRTTWIIVQLYPESFRLRHQTSALEGRYGHLYVSTYFLKWTLVKSDADGIRTLRKQRLLRIEPELTLSSPGVFPWSDPFPGVRPGGFIPPFRADTYGFRQRERDLGSFWQRAMMAVSKFLGLIQGAASFGCLSIQGTLSARIQCSSDGYVV